MNPVSWIDIMGSVNRYIPNYTQLIHGMHHPRTDRAQPPGRSACQRLVLEISEVVGWRVRQRCQDFTLRFKCKSVLLHILVAFSSFLFSCSRFVSHSLRSIDPTCSLWSSQNVSYPIFEDEVGSQTLVFTSIHSIIAIITISMRNTAMALMVNFECYLVCSLIMIRLTFKWKQATMGSFFMVNCFVDSW